MVEMEDGTQHQISTASMLAVCEPAYEHFGAWTEETQKYIREGYARFGPFRVFPPADSITKGTARMFRAEGGRGRKTGSTFDGPK